MKGKTTEHIPEKKLKSVNELADLMKKNKTILVADVGSIPGSQFQAISKKLRGKATVKVPKRNLFYMAIEKSGKKEAAGLKEKINGAVAILFSNLDAYDLAAELIKNKSAAKAKPGQIAPKEIEIPAGPTELTPGPAISELGALGIQIMIQGGKIEIKAPKVLAKEGEAISQKAADMLSKLNILPFTIGFIPLAAYDSDVNTIYVDIKVDREEAVNSLKEAFGRALPFAVNVGYTSEETIKFLVQKAGRHANALENLSHTQSENGESSTSD